MSTTEDRQDESQVYEVSYLLLPSIPEENISQVVANIESSIEKHGGKKIDGEAPFLRELAYEISKVVGASRYVVRQAYIGWVKFELPLEDDRESHPVENIKTEIEKMTEVLRFLLVKAERETRFTFASTRVAKEELPEADLEDPESADEEIEVDEDLSVDEDETVVE